jgi:hypothetical protein
MLDTMLSRAELSELSSTIQALEFDTVFRIDEGKAYILTAESAPEVYHDEDEDVIILANGDSSLWETVSDGLTGQYGYNGPVMHASENMSAGIAERLVELSDDYDAYALVIVEVFPEDNDEMPEPAGWAIIGRRSF